MAKWDGFVQACLPLWEENALTGELLEIVEDKDMAVVMWACLGDEVLSWLNYKVPMLKKKKPIDFLKNEKGREELKSMLISNPWWSALNRETKEK